MAISDSTISVDVFTEIRNKLVSTAPYVTNSSTSATYAASINAVYNDKNTTKPQIVIYPARISEDTFRFGGTEGKKAVNVNIECYYQNTLGVDQLSDQIKTALKANDIIGIDLVGIVTDYAFTNPAESKFHLKTMTFTYTRE